MSRGAGRAVQTGAPLLKDAIEAYLARPKLRSDIHKREFRRQLHLHLRDWLRLLLDEISKRMVVERHRALEKVPSSANHTLRRFRAVWNHARRTHDLPECPTLAIEWYEEAPDGRVIGATSSSAGLVTARALQFRPALKAVSDSPLLEGEEPGYNVLSSSFNG